jgi:imidazole glycerol-phosphate synthase subunit HisH
MINVAIIDYEMGNLFSVMHACEYVGLNPIVTKDHKIILNSDGAILPGVGAFAEAMSNIRRLGLDIIIKEFISTGKPFMGICLGLQLLFSESEEFGKSKGLGIIEGQVLKFPNKNVDGKNIRVPQIGWNKIYANNTENGKEKWQNSILSSVENGEFMYFVHSFYVKPSLKSVQLSLTNYDGVEYCSSILYNNIFASQFHPEKSAIKGISIYKNWCDSIKRFIGSN